MKPRILISGSQGSREHYENAVRSVGGEPLSFYCPPLDIPCDGLLLAGGGDISPHLFGQEDAGSRNIDLERDKVEFALMERFVAEGKPVLGICRGHQTVNVALGGTLLQDIGPERVLFHSPASSLGNGCFHAVRMADASVLAEMYGEIAVVNSAHHQVVDRLGTGMRITAWSESGFIEALEHERLPIYTVQFHPERLMGEVSYPEVIDGRVIFQFFITQCCSGEE